MKKQNKLKGKLNKLVESLKKKLRKAKKESKKDEDRAMYCEIKMEEYVKEISKLKAMLQQKSEFHQLQEEQYRLKEEEFEKDMKTKISNKDEKLH